MAKRSTAPDAIKLLKKDHAEVAAMFEKYEKGHKRLSNAQKKSLAGEICDALKVHTRIEEEIFYPACQEDIKGAEDILAEAKVEHQGAKHLIAKIEGGRPGSDEYDAMVKVLGEYITHHVKEEHTDLFPKARKSGMDLKALGADLAARKASLMKGGNGKSKSSGLLASMLAVTSARH